VYTIGVGTNGEAPYPYGGQVINVPVEIDETTLNKIATITDGNYYRATSNSALKEVYEKIDKLERTKLSVKEFSSREEEYALFAAIALASLLLELLLRFTLLRRIP
jgi:Ca-activated chloride channel family protein